MSAVRKWTQFLRAIVVAVGILLLGLAAFRVGVIQDPSLALWPTYGLLHLENLDGQPLWSLAIPAAVQVAIWTTLAYFLFAGLEGFRRGASRRR